MVPQGLIEENRRMKSGDLVKDVFSCSEKLGFIVQCIKHDIKKTGILSTNYLVFWMDGTRETFGEYSAIKFLKVVE